LKKLAREKEKGQIIYNAGGEEFLLIILDRIDYGERKSSLGKNEQKTKRRKRLYSTYFINDITTVHALVLVVCDVR